MTEVGIDGSVHQPQLETARIGDPHHVRPVVSPVRNGVWRPGCARGRDRRVDPLVAVDGRIEDGAQRIRRMHDPAEEIVGKRRETKFAIVRMEDVVTAILVP